MSLGQRLIELRKRKQLSQEEVAEKLNVTRQTISKWETDGSTPDFDKIIPLCNLYDITPDELLTGTKGNKTETSEITKEVKTRKRAIGISLGVLGYFLSIIWIMIAIPVFRMNPIIASAIFLAICGLSTFYIIYTVITHKKDESLEEKQNKTLYKQIEGIISTITLIIYLGVSFITGKWSITWIIWIIYILVIEIVKLIFTLRGIPNEE